MAYPGDILPSNIQNGDLRPTLEPEKESPVGNEQVGEKRLLAEDSSTAASSTGSTPAAFSALALPLQSLNNVYEEVPACQRPPEITPRGIRRTKPLRQKEGVFIQPWEFKFELLSELKLSHANKGGPQGKKQPLPAKKKTAPTIRKIQSASSTMATVSGDSASRLTEVESPSLGASAAGHRRQYGKLHTTRVEFLLKKYLQDPSDVLINGQEQELDSAIPAEGQVRPPACAAAALIPPSPRYKKHPENFPKRATKSIMQVKGEQDAAVRAMQHAPRQFHAKTIPLEVAAPRGLKKPTTSVTSVSAEIAITSQKNIIEGISIKLTPRGSISSKTVPPSTTEPRYALLVADSVLRRYSAVNQASLDNSIGDTFGASSGGLQKWLSWPARNEDQNEPSAHLQPGAQLPQRPQSARLRRGSQSPVLNNSQLPDIVEKGPDQLKEFH